MDYRLLMDTSILAGEIIMENGGEAYRAEETVNRMLNTSNAQHGGNGIQSLPGRDHGDTPDTKKGNESPADRTGQRHLP